MRAQSWIAVGRRHALDTEEETHVVKVQCVAVCCDHDDIDYVVVLLLITT